MGGWDPQLLGARTGPAFAVIVEMLSSRPMSRRELLPVVVERSGIQSKTFETLFDGMTRFGLVAGRRDRLVITELGIRWLQTAEAQTLFARFGGAK